MRIDKLLSNLNYGSRTEVRNLIKDKRVLLNDNIITNYKVIVNPKVDKISIDGKVLVYFEEIYLMLNKPKGYVSANIDNLHKTVIELINEPYNRYDLKIAGRLDLDTEGLLILTSVSNFVHSVTSPNNKISKIYEVTLDKDYILDEKIFEGVIIKDGNNKDYLAKALKVEIISNRKVLITIDEGKFHQVKRMFRYFNYEVVELKRIQVGNLNLGNLKLGEYREFKKEELL